MEKQKILDAISVIEECVAETPNSELDNVVVSQLFASVAFMVKRIG